MGPSLICVGCRTAAPLRLIDVALWATVVGAVTSIPVIVGIGATDAAQSLAHDAAMEGAAGLLLAPVNYTRLTEKEAFEHFLAEPVPDEWEPSTDVCCGEYAGIDRCPAAENFAGSR